MMQFNYNGQANEPGIYVIFNTQKWRIYVGQAQCFKVRWRQHISSLTNNKHQNRFLQADFNQCGMGAFEFHVLEIMPNSTKEERNLR
jgi:group I intron endonuclease